MIIVNVTDLNDSNFNEFTNEGISLVDVWAPWCGPCKMISPVFEQLAGQNAGKIIFAKVDVDEAQDVARACGVTSMPTFQLHKGGKLVSSFSGADPQRLQALVAEALKL